MRQRSSRARCAPLVPLAIGACLGGILFSSPTLGQGEGTGAAKQDKTKENFQGYGKLEKSAHKLDKTKEIFLSFDKTGKLHKSEPVARPPMAASPKPITGVLPPTIEKPDPDCGVHALYIFLRLHDTNCTLDQLRKRLTLTEQGANMLQLKEGAAEWGVSTAVVTLSADQFEPAVPFIARMKTPDAPTEGHYVVVTQVTNDRITVLDSTAGGTITSPRARFEEEFSGYALIVVEKTSLWYWVRVVLVVVCVVQLGLAAFFVFSRNRPAPAPTSGALGTGK